MPHKKKKKKKKKKILTCLLTQLLYYLITCFLSSVLIYMLAYSITCLLDLLLIYSHSDRLACFIRFVVNYSFTIPAYFTSAASHTVAPRSSEMACPWRTCLALTLFNSDNDDCLWSQLGQLCDSSSYVIISVVLSTVLNLVRGYALVSSVHNVSVQTQICLSIVCHYTVV